MSQTTGCQHRGIRFKCSIIFFENRNIKLCAESPSGCQEQSLKNQEKGFRCPENVNTLQDQAETNPEYVQVCQVSGF